MAPEVRVPVLREPRGEEGRLVPQSPAALFPVGLPGGPFLVPRGGSGIPSVLFPFSGLDHVGGDPMQDLRWEWAASEDPSASCSSFYGAWGLVHPQNRVGRRACAWETVSYPQAPRPSEAGSLSPWSRSADGGGAGVGRVKAAIAVQRGPGSPARPLGAGGQQAASSRAGGGLWPRSRPRTPQPVLGSRGRHCGTRSPAPPVGRRKRLLLFGEEAESLFLVFLAKAGVRASDGGQGQALGLDADALGLVDGGAHALQPGQHLLLQGGRVRPHTSPKDGREALGLPLLRELSPSAPGSPRAGRGCPALTSSLPWKSHSLPLLNLGGQRVSCPGPPREPLPGPRAGSEATAPLRRTAPER